MSDDPRVKAEPRIDLEQLHQVPPAAARPQLVEDPRDGYHLVVPIALGIVLGWAAVSAIKLLIGALALGALAAKLG